MSKRHLIDQWRSGARSGHRIADVKKELERLGFTVEQSTKHWKAKHPDLKGCPDFPFGLVVFSTHANGNQGEIDAAAIRDFLRAAKWLEEK